MQSRGWPILPTLISRKPGVCRCSRRLFLVTKLSSTSSAPFAADFTRAQIERGVELFWIGLGTWRVPTEIFPETRIVPQQHIEAWKISRENLGKSNGISSGYFEREATVQKFVTLI